MIHFQKRQVLALVGKASIAINECIANPKNAVLLSLRTQPRTGGNQPDSATVHAVPFNTGEDVAFSFGEIPEVPPL